jgi:hypothetical protein
MAAQVSLPCPLPDGVRAYVVRGNDMVPLIPVDQLPFQLQGIPRRLTHRQMSDENWKLLQEINHPATPLSVQKPSSISSAGPSSAQLPRFLAPDHRVRTEPMHAIDVKQHKHWSVPAQVVEKGPEHSSISGATAPEGPSSLVDRFASIYSKDAQRIGYRIPYPSGIEPDPSKKVFCDHWIRTSECGYMQQGCKYKHEMPTLDKLREIGFTQVPKWWKEKTAITSRGPTWMQRRLASSKDDDESGDGSGLRAFPDPSTFRTRQPDVDDSAREEPAARTFINIVSKKATPPLSPASKSSGRQDSQISDLLIDLRETPALPPSPQPSDISLASAGSCETQPQLDHASASTPVAPLDSRGEASTTASVAIPSRAEQMDKPGGPPQLPAIRRRSLISWPSDSDQGATPVKSINKRKNPSRRSSRRPNQPGKHQSGIAKSKHAAADTNASTNQTRNAEAGRKMPQRSGNEAGDPKIEIPRGTYLKERARRSMTGERGPKWMGYIES